MPTNAGDIRAGATLGFWFETTAALSAATVVVYKNGSTTESSTGVTVTPSYDGVTGLNYVEIDTSADGAFYATGKDFAVVLTAGTVSAASIAPKVIDRFSIQNRVATLANTAHTITGLVVNGQFLVTNSSGDAVKFLSTGGNGSGLVTTGQGTGHGHVSTGGAGNSPFFIGGNGTYYVAIAAGSGQGMKCLAANGNAISLETVSGEVVYITSPNSTGVEMQTAQQCVYMRGGADPGAGFVASAIYASCAYGPVAFLRAGSGFEPLMFVAGGNDLESGSPITASIGGNVVISSSNVGLSS